MAQNGWVNMEINGEPTRLPFMVAITHAMSKPCQYTLTTPDANCNGCQHQKV